MNVKTLLRGAPLSNALANSVCAICGKPVPLESAKADEEGHTVHEQCYVRKMQGKRQVSELKN